MRKSTGIFACCFPPGPTSIEERGTSRLSFLCSVPQCKAILQGLLDVLGAVDALRSSPAVRAFFTTEEGPPEEEGEALPPTPPRFELPTVLDILYTMT